MKVHDQRVDRDLQGGVFGGSGPARDLDWGVEHPFTLVAGKVDQGFQVGLPDCRHEVARTANRDLDPMVEILGRNQRGIGQKTQGHREAFDLERVESVEQRTGEAPPPGLRPWRASVRAICSGQASSRKAPEAPVGEVFVLELQEFFQAAAKLFRGKVVVQGPIVSQADGPGFLADNDGDGIAFFGQSQAGPVSGAKTLAQGGIFAQRVEAPGPKQCVRLE